jgi:MFS family permease
MWPIVICYLIAYVIAGMAIGVASGLLASLITRCRPRVLSASALLGSFGFLAGFLLSAFVPWPTNTVVEHLESGGSVSTTVDRYQHPERVAIVLSVFLPLLYELRRLRRARTHATGKAAFN